MLSVLWRSGRDSNPRAIARKLISSQPRYDHFDTAPYSIQFDGHFRHYYSVLHFLKIVNLFYKFLLLFFAL